MKLTTREKRSAIDWDSGLISVNQQAQLLGLSKGGLYYEVRPEGQYNLELMDLIDKQYLETPFFGSRQMTLFLRNNGHEFNRKRVQRLMQIMGIRGIAPGPNTSLRHPEHKVYPYLLRNLLIDTPNKVWASDITYIRLRSGFAYLVAIMDWFSRYVLSWRLSNSLEHSFCVEALEEAINKYGCPDIMNTDQGCQYTSENFIEKLETHNIAISMDGKGRALDNIMIERIWRSL